MSSRRRAGNPGNASPAVSRRYELRDRAKNVQQSSVGTRTSPERDPQTPEPGNQGDIAGFVRPLIKKAGAEKKHRTVEQNVKSKSTRTSKPVEPDSDSTSESSDYSNSSRGLPAPTNLSSRSITKRQPSPARPFDPYTDESSLFRPPIKSSVGSAKKQPSQDRQPMDFTNDDKVKKKEIWIDHEEEEAIQVKQKPKAQLNKFCYKEDSQIRRSTNRGEESILSRRFPQQPKENKDTQLAQSRAHIGFSDDDEERVTLYQQQKRAFAPRFKEGEEMNHYPNKVVEQKAKMTRKHPTKSFLHFSGTCIKYLAPVLLVLLLVSAAVLYISPESVLKMTGQMLFTDKPQVKKNLTDDFEKLSGIFPDQSQLMWNRSRRILERHLENWKGNAEPAIILLAGAQDAEQTLLCVGTRLAEIYSSSLSGNYTVISGSDLVSGSNEEVKQHIDDNLSAGFQTTSKAAVLHRLELLPAGSLLILYKYCDHESAVFKNVMLLLTVLMDDATLAKDIPLLDLEEKVREFLILKVIDSNTKASHDGMDRDKFSGVWSRISHVVLPVFPEKKVMEHCAKKPN